MSRGREIFTVNLKKHSFEKIKELLSDYLLENAPLYNSCEDDYCEREWFNVQKMEDIGDFINHLSCTFDRYYQEHEPLVVGDEKIYDFSKSQLPMIVNDRIILYCTNYSDCYYWFFRSNKMIDYEIEID
jgi:hypothetical protein